MACSDLYVVDSQTMAAEAGVLGVTFVRFNDYVGSISYLDELENTYQMGYGFKTSQADEMKNKVSALITEPALKNTFAQKREKLLAGKINYASFLIWFTKNCPRGNRIRQGEPGNKEGLGDLKKKNEFRIKDKVKTRIK